MSSPFSRGRPRIWRERDGIGSLPRSWAAYRFRQPEGIAYLGITSNLYSRISQHRSVQQYYNPTLHVVEYQIAQPGSDWDQLCQWEKAKIAQHSPELVTYIGGNGRRPAIEINGELVEVAQDESIEDVLVEMGFFERMGSILKFW